MALTQAQIDQLKADSSVLTADAAGTDAQLAPVQATAATLAAQVAGLQVVVDPPPPPPPGVTITLAGNNFGHEVQNWLADTVDASKLTPRSVPWTLPEIVQPMNGAKPARIRCWHTFGQEMGLYSQLPMAAKRWTPQVGDQFKAIVSDLAANPVPDGPRGVNVISPYGTAIGHPHIKPADGTPIPRHPTWLWGRHDGIVQFLYHDGSARTVGQIPGVSFMHDWNVDEINRKVFYVADLGTPNSAGVFSGGKIKKVDRATGAQTIDNPEDASKYVVTDLLTGLVYPTSVCGDEAGNVYAVDFGTSRIYRNAVEWLQIPNAFGIRYHAGTLFVVTSNVNLFAISCATGEITTLAALNAVTFAPGGQYMTISIDRAGTFDKVGNIALSRSHGAGNLDVWIYDGTLKTAQVKYGAGMGYMKVGDVSYQQEPYGHYPWAFAYHPTEARVLAVGFTSVPHELIAYKTTAEAPAEESATDAFQNGYKIGNYAMQLIRNGGTLSVQKTLPSFTCLMTREGWSLFGGCSSDEIALMAFPDQEAWIRGGMIGSFPRNFTDKDMYALLVFFNRQSQRFLLQGGALMASLKAWWLSTGRTVPVF